MKPGIVLRVAAVYMGLVGLGLILAPGRFGTGALPTDASAELIAFLRLWGSPLLGIAVLDWLMRDAEPSRALDAVMTGNIVGFATIALIDVWGVLEGGARRTRSSRSCTVSSRSRSSSRGGLVVVAREAGPSRSRPESGSGCPTWAWSR